MSFAYTSGNPDNLVGGANASMSDISGPFADLKVYLTGNVDSSALATGAVGSDELGVTAKQFLKGPYETVTEIHSRFTDTDTSGVKYITHQGLIASGSSTNSQFCSVPIKAADHALSGLTAKLRTRVSMMGTPGTTLTFGLYPITSVIGGTDAITLTLGTVVSGSTVATSGTGNQEGSDFSLPSDNFYVLGVSLAGAVTANAFGSFSVRLERHWI